MNIYATLESRHWIDVGTSMLEERKKRSEKGFRNQVDYPYGGSN